MKLSMYIFAAVVTGMADTVLARIANNDAVAVELVNEGCVVTPTGAVTVGPAKPCVNVNWELKTNANTQKFKGGISLWENCDFVDAPDPTVFCYPEWKPNTVYSYAGCLPDSNYLLVADQAGMFQSAKLTVNGKPVPLNLPAAELGAFGTCPEYVDPGTVDPGHQGTPYCGLFVPLGRKNSDLPLVETAADCYNVEIGVLTPSFHVGSWYVDDKCHPEEAPLAVCHDLEENTEYWFKECLPKTSYQFVSDFNDGGHFEWIKILVDGTEVWTYHLSDSDDLPIFQYVFGEDSCSRTALAMA